MCSAWVLYKSVGLDRPDVRPSQLKPGADHKFQLQRYGEILFCFVYTL